MSDSAAAAQDAGRCCSPDAYTSTAPSALQQQPAGGDWLAGRLRSATSSVQRGLIAVHEATGAPWWLTIAGAGVGVRLLCAPAVLHASTVGSNIMSGKRNAMRHVTYLLGEPTAAAWPTVAEHEARRKRLAPQLAPGSTNRLHLGLPLLQVLCLM